MSHKQDGILKSLHDKTIAKIENRISTLMKMKKNLTENEGAAAIYANDPTTILIHYLASLNP